MAESANLLRCSILDLNNKDKKQDWNPFDPIHEGEPFDTYDRLRRRCPIAYSDRLGWSVFRHEDVTNILNNHSAFSNVVSSHPAVPNGYDPPRHTEYRQTTDHFFSPKRLASFEPKYRELIVTLLQELQGKTELDFVRDFAEPLSARAQCLFMGWGQDAGNSFLSWLRKSQAATKKGDREELNAVAEDFGDLIRDLLRPQQAEHQGEVLAELRQLACNGNLLTESEIISLVRNWTVGELGTLSASLSIIARGLSMYPTVQKKLRSRPALIPYAIEEFLRIDGPLLLNRRRVNEASTVGSRVLKKGDLVTLIWPSANRDHTVFRNPERFQWNRNLRRSLLYGRGIHSCPGASLSRLELNTAIQVLLTWSKWWTLSLQRTPVRAPYPAGGYSELPLTIDWQMD